MTLEEIQSAIETLQHKDVYTDEDRARISDLERELELKRREVKEERVKNPYFEMAVMVNNLIRPNGRWNTNVKVWSELRDEVVDFILRKKIKKEGEENGIA